MKILEKCITRVNKNIRIYHRKQTRDTYHRKRSPWSGYHRKFIMTSDYNL